MLNDGMTGKGADLMSEVLRGQEGFPTDDTRRSVGPVDQNIVPKLPSADDWEQPEKAQAAIEATRDALASQERSGNMEVDRTSESARNVDDMEQICLLYTS